MSIRPTPLVFIAVNDFPPFEDLGVRGSDFEDNFLDVRSANLEGEKLGREEHNDISRRKIKAPTRGSPSSGHGNLNHRAPGVKELAELGKLSYRINAQFAKGMLIILHIGNLFIIMQSIIICGPYPDLGFATLCLRESGHKFAFSCPLQICTLIDANLSYVSEKRMEELHVPQTRPDAGTRNPSIRFLRHNVETQIPSLSQTADEMIESVSNIPYLKAVPKKKI